MNNREQLSPDDQAELEKLRTLSDAELLEEGGKYVIKDNDKRLEVTQGRYDRAQDEMERTSDIRKEVDDFLKKNQIESKEVLLNSPRISIWEIAEKFTQDEVKKWGLGEKPLEAFYEIARGVDEGDVNQKEKLIEIISAKEPELAKMELFVLKLQGPGFDYVAVSKGKLAPIYHWYGQQLNMDGTEQS